MLSINKLRPAFFSLFLGIVLSLFACRNSSSSQADQPGPTPCACVSSVISADEVAGKTRNHACEKGSISQTIKDYAEAINSMDYSGCPLGFTQAMHTHADAWSKLLLITDHYPGKRGEMHDLFSILKAGPEGEAFSLLEDEVWATWEEVEKAAEACDTGK